MKILRFILIGLLALSGVGLLLVLFQVKAEQKEKASKQTEAARAKRWQNKKSENINENYNEDFKELEALDSSGADADNIA